MASPKAVISIDLGTSRTGYSYKVLHDDDDESAPIVRAYQTGLQEDSTGKTASFVVASLPDDAESRVVSNIDPECGYGFAAVKTTRSMDSKQMEEKSIAAFKEFKMTLFDSEYDAGKGVPKNNPIPTTTALQTGRVFETLPIISLLLGKMKEEAMKSLNGAGEYCANITSDECKWVLTVPAIWSLHARSLMRQAAIDAGLPSERTNLLLCLEPEAAAVRCTKEPDIVLNVGDKFIVLDAGGGTFDVVVFKMGEDKKTGKKTMSQLEGFPASGGDWGSQFLDRNFETLLDDIFGENLMKVARKSNGYHEVLDAFVRLKSRHGSGSFTIDKADSMSITSILFCGKGWDISVAYKKIGEYNKKHHESIEFDNGFMKLPPTVIAKLFDPVVEPILSHVKNLVTKVSPKQVFLVGGFAQNMHLQTSLRDLIVETNPSVGFFVPPQPGAAVMKGACYYGMDPTIIDVRVSNMSYGISLNKPNVGKYTTKDVIVVGGVEMARGCFEPFVTRGTAIQVDEEFEYRSSPTYPDQDASSYRVFCSPGEPAFTSNPSCKLLGEATLHFQRKDDEDATKRIQIAKFRFGGTDLTMTVEDSSTNEVVSLEVEFDSSDLTNA